MRKTKAQRGLEKSCTTFMGMHTDPENVRGLIEPRWFGGRDDARYKAAIDELVGGVKEAVRSIFLHETSRIATTIPTQDSLPMRHGYGAEERGVLAAMMKSALKEAGTQMFNRVELADGFDESECRAQFADRLKEMP